MYQVKNIRSRTRLARVTLVTEVTVTDLFVYKKVPPIFMKAVHE